MHTRSRRNVSPFTATLLALSMALASSAAGVVLRPVAAHADSPDPVAAFDWSMPDRSVDANHDGFIDSYFSSETIADSYTANNCCSVPKDQIDPSSWTVNVDACASLPGSSGSPIQDYAFSLAGTLLSSGSSCQQALTFPAQGTYSVDLAVTDAAGGTGTTSVAVTVKDVLVVSLGDSYGSGEGNPPFQDTRCDRSSKAASAQAAERLEQSSPHFSVTFIHLACSGAQILDGDATDGIFGGGILDPYQGQHPVQAPSGTIVPLNPQIDDMKALIGHRKVDALVVATGANDLGLVDIVKNCVDFSYLADPVAWLLLPNCDTHIPLLDSQGVDIFNRGIQAFPGRLSTLKDRLNNLTVLDQSTGHLVPAISPEHVYLTEYPDATRDGAGNYCTVFNAVGFPGFDQTEWRWASQTVIAGLNQALAQAAGNTGWNYVGGIAGDFFSHGYCAANNWVFTVSDVIQHPELWDGVIHPNLAGQIDVADHLTFAIEHDLAHPPQPPSITLFPGAFTLIDTPGGGGWFTGECDFVFGNGCDRNQVNASLILNDPIGVAEPLAANLVVTLDGQALTITPTSAVDFSCSLPSGVINTCFVQVLDPPHLTALLVAIHLHQSGVHQMTMTATNTQGRVVSQIFTMRVDLNLPILNPTQVQGTAGQNGWYRSAVDLAFSASDPTPGSGLNRIETLLLGEGANGAAAALPTIGDPTVGPVTAHLASEGEHHISAEAVDSAELRSGQQVTIVKIDTRAPSLQGAPDRAPDRNGWYRHDVTVHFAATDPTPGSGVDAASLTPDFVLHEGAAQTVNGSVADIAGNPASASVGPISIDETPPTIAITAPSNGVYTLNQSVVVHYGCADALSGYDTCSGPVPDGGGLDTRSPGPKTFTVQAMDKAGNTISRSISYTVAYNVCALYDQTRSVKAGATIPIKLSLCDAANLDVSSSSLVVTATGLSQVSGTASGSLDDASPANPDSNFRFDASLGTAGGYIYNLSTRGLATGTYALSFRAGADPTAHSVRFQVR